MIVKSVFIDNALRNFNYIIACPDSGDALVIDPLAAEQCYQLAQQHDWHITQILNTHEHWDHIGGNEKMVELTGAKLLAHAGAENKIPNIDRGLYAGNIIKVGNHIELEVLDTPGHTDAHVCALSHTETPSLFCGDTLFNAGAGNCHSGDPESLYHSFSQKLALLADNTEIYPGHDYIQNNLRFTLDREPDNVAAKQLLAQLDQFHDPHNPLITTLAQEKQINTFFRLHSETVQENLLDKFPELVNNASEQQIFIALRELRNHW